MGSYWKSIVQDDVTHHSKRSILGVDLANQTQVLFFFIPRTYTSIKDDGIDVFTNAKNESQDLPSRNGPKHFSGYAQVQG